MNQPGGALPPSVAANPRLGDWLRVLPAGVIEVRPGKVELGQGVLTALVQIAAEELDVSPARVRMMPAVTGMSPDEGYTAGSLSVQHSGGALRLVCAEARGRYLAVGHGQLVLGDAEPGQQLLGTGRRRAARPARHRRLPALAGVRVSRGRHQPAQAGPAG